MKECSAYGVVDQGGGKLEEANMYEEIDQGDGMWEEAHIYELPKWPLITDKHFLMRCSYLLEEQVFFH